MYKSFQETVLLDSEGPQLDWAWVSGLHRQGSDIGTQQCPDHQLVRWTVFLELASWYMLPQIWFPRDHPKPEWPELIQGMWDWKMKEGNGSGARKSWVNMELVKERKSHFHIYEVNYLTRFTHSVLTAHIIVNSVGRQTFQVLEQVMKDRVACVQAWKLVWNLSLFSFEGENADP